MERMKRAELWIAALARGGFLVSEDEYRAVPTSDKLANNKKRGHLLQPPRVDCHPRQSINPSSFTNKPRPTPRRNPTHQTHNTRTKILAHEFIRLDRATGVTCAEKQRQGLITLIPGWCQIIRRTTYFNIFC